MKFELQATQIAGWNLEGEPAKRHAFNVRAGSQGSRADKDRERSQGQFRAIRSASIFRSSFRY